MMLRVCRTQALAGPKLLINLTRASEDVLLIGIDSFNKMFINKYLNEKLYFGYVEPVWIAFRVLPDSGEKHAISALSATDSSDPKIPIDQLLRV